MTLVWFYRLHCVSSQFWFWPWPPSYDLNSLRKKYGKPVGFLHYSEVYRHETCIVGKIKFNSLSIDDNKWNCCVFCIFNFYKRLIGSSAKLMLKAFLFCFFGLATDYFPAFAYMYVCKILTRRVCETWLPPEAIKSKYGKISRSHILTPPPGAGELSVQV